MVQVAIELFPLRENMNVLILECAHHDLVNIFARHRFLAKLDSVQVLADVPRQDFRRAAVVPFCLQFSCFLELAKTGISRACCICHRLG